MGLFRRDRASKKQIAYVEDLLSRWDPDAPQHYEGASARTFREALEAAGVSSVRELRRLSKAEASEAIDALKRL